MKLFVFITDDWGSSRGGINSLNSDLVLACAEETKDDKSSRIVCVIPELSDAVQAELTKQGVIPITLSRKGFESDEAAKLIFDLIQKNTKLKPYFPEPCNTFCIGHDIYSGALSKKLADMCDGWNIVFHHMNYQPYYMLTAQDTEKYDNKIAVQKKILNDADMVFGVGPLLYKSAKNKVRENSDRIKVREFMPGLANTTALAENDDDFIPIVFGRVENSNQIIKQTVLAIDAFANAIGQDRQTPVIGLNATLNVYGYDGSDKERLRKEVIRLQQDAQKIAGRVCNVVPHAFLTDRKALMDALRYSSAAMMLSFHEGFGLVGYEAIAAGVPLILTKNSGLYQFLARNHYENLIHAVDIEGSNDQKGYSPADLEAVTKALRDIRLNEKMHKDNALELRRRLREDDRRSWNACARKFLNDIQDTYQVEPPRFFAPQDMTELQEQIASKEYSELQFRLKAGKRVYSVTGRNALASLCKHLKDRYFGRFQTYIYSEKSEDPRNTYTDFVCSCYTLLGQQMDKQGNGADRIPTSLLQGKILILNDIPLEPKEKFKDLFERLNESTKDFYVFCVFEDCEAVRVAPYSSRSAARPAGIPASSAPVQLSLTDSQKLLAKILAFREEEDYRDYLIRYICRGLNDACAEMGRSPVIEDPENQVQALQDVGLIRRYTKYSFRNTEACLAAAREHEVDMELYARGLASMGRSYARAFFDQREWNPEMPLAYFGCRCYAQAAFISETVKAAIQQRYESLLKSMRIPAKNISDYSQYHQSLRCYLDLYQTPLDMWRWYDLFHCETICAPSRDTLEQIRKMITGGMFTDPDLKLQMFRLCAELEYDLSVPGALQRFAERIDAVPTEKQMGTPWEQALNSAINIAIYCGELDTADRYMDILKKTCSETNQYSPMVIKALETELDIAHHRRGDPVDLGMTFSRINDANRYAKQVLRDARSIGWTQGLLGECQFLRDDPRGENTLRNSMDNRAKGEECTMTYRQWLQRLKQYDLKEFRSRKLLEKELERTQKLVPVWETKNKFQVFVSYSTRDRERAEKIVEQMEARDVKCWFAPRDIPMGSSYIREIPRAISGCSHFLLVQSADSQESNWVARELILANNHGKYVMPMMIREHEPNDEYQFLLAKTQSRPYYRDPEAVIREAVNIVRESDDE